MDTLIQQIVSGLATGGIYGSVALALVMIYQATEVVNYAQGEMAMFSTYLAWTLINAGLPYWVAFFATLAIAFVGGLLLERILIRPVENAPVLTIVIVCIGLLVILNSVAGWIYSYIQKPFPSPFPSKPDPGRQHLLRRARHRRARRDAAWSWPGCTSSSGSPRWDWPCGRRRRIRCPADSAASAWAGCSRWGGAWPRWSARWPA